MRLRLSRLLWIFGYGVGVVGLSATPPAWWDNPVREDGGHFFFAASGVSREGEDDAFRLAMADVYSQIADRVGAGEDEELRAYIASRAAGGSLHAREHARSRGRHHIWMIYRLPRGEIDRVRTHIEGASIKFERAAKARQEGRASEALSLLRELQTEYPLGEQPVFQTERAGLLAVECLVDLGKPREALDTVRRWTALDTNEAWRKAFEQKRSEVEEAFPDLLLKSLFLDETLEITAWLELEDTREEWRRMKKELMTMATSSGARVKELPSGHGVLKAVASGRMNRRENDRASGPGYDSQFAGKVTILLDLPGQEPISWELEGMSGWNPLGRKMCLDVVALQMLSVWKKDLIQQLDSP